VPTNPAAHRQPKRQHLDEPHDEFYEKIVGGQIGRPARQCRQYFEGAEKTQDCNMAMSYLDGHVKI
jgi:hypothetical protein